MKATKEIVSEKDKKALINAMTRITRKELLKNKHFYKKN